MKERCRAALAGLAALALAACGGGGGGGGGGGDPGGSGLSGETPPVGCTGDCPQQALTTAEVELIVSTAVAEASAQGVGNATIAVLDRLGNVLAVFQMTGADPGDPLTPLTTVSSQRGTMQGLDGVAVPATLAAISKAGTAAYLSSQGNAFTTRTASFIIQENFTPGEETRPGGPLFGVQFSQLPCGDFVRRLSSVEPGPNPSFMAGPKRMPLGFSADPGGIPLYKNGVPVGGVGIEFDGDYTLDLDAIDEDVDLEERVASGAARPFRAPEARRAENIFVDGRSFPFADDEAASGAAPVAFSTMGLVTVPGFFVPDPGPAVLAGVQFLDPASGFVESSSTFQGRMIPIEVRGIPDITGSGFVEMYPATNHPDPGGACAAFDLACDSFNPLPVDGGLQDEEVLEILRSALDVAFRARAQIRTPLGDRVRVNVHVVDRAGVVLGFARSQDAPIFGADVSLQKARTAAFFSNREAGQQLIDMAIDEPMVFAFATALSGTDYVSRVQAFFSSRFGINGALTDGTAFSDRAGGNLSRPFFPDGDNGSANGPLSRPFAEWSPFGTGLQFDAIIDRLLDAAVNNPTNGSRFSCTSFSGMNFDDDPTTLGPLATVRNGFQIFPGSVPIYRGNQLIGGLGVSGDGVDQDDLVAFLGLHNAGVQLGSGVGNAPEAIRANTVTGGQLRYVNCPASAFIDEDADDVCNGK